VQKEDLRVNKLEELGQVKFQMTPEKLCTSEAHKLLPFVRLAFSYEFTDEPDYSKLKFVLVSPLLETGGVPTD
jgi:hypothetical protein